MSGSNDLTVAQADRLNRHVWTPGSVLDLHKDGVHYFDPAVMPSTLDPYTYATMLHRGLTPPNALPTAPLTDGQGRIDAFLRDNYFRLVDAGVQYVGNEFNVQPRSDWDRAKVRVCLCRLSTYRILDGAFGGFLIGNFINDYTPSEDIFIDYAFFPESPDIGKLLGAGLPLMFGNTTHRPLTDFDIVIFATSYPGERVNLPVALVKSGIPLHRWERFSKDLPYRAYVPMVALAGIGASFTENLLGDNPIHGPAGNAFADHVLIGEGEMMDLKYIQEYLNTVVEDGGDRDAFCAALTNRHHAGVYDPTLVLFEYADKVHTSRDHRGEILREDRYEAGGHIRAIHLLDREGRLKYAMAGPDSEEFRDMQRMNDQFRLRFAPGADPIEIGKRYVKVSDRPTKVQREAAGMLPIGAGAQAMVAADRKAGEKRVSPPTE